MGWYHPFVYLYGGYTMTTHETLEVYLERCKDAQKEIGELLDSARSDVTIYERQQAVVHGQIMTLEQLMDYDNNPPVVDMPLVEEDVMEKAHDKRLDMFDGVTPEEFLEDRKEVVYKREAMDFVDTIDAINNETP
jgi:hypothetical protein